MPTLAIINLGDPSTGIGGDTNRQAFLTIAANFVLLNALLNPASPTVFGINKQSAALTAAAATALTTNSATPILPVPVLTPVASILNVLGINVSLAQQDAVNATFVGEINKINARLENLIANLKTAGVQT
jgi:hypothetical protein